MWNFTGIGPKTKKLWLSRVQKFTFSIYYPARTLSGQPGFGPTQKGVNATFLRRNRTSRTLLKALDLGSLNMQFQQDWPKDKKNYSSFNFLPENLEKFRSTKLHGAPPEGSTIFLYRSSLGHKSLESSRLGGLRYGISAG